MVSISYANALIIPTLIENRKGFVKDSEFNQLGAGPAVTWLLHALAAVLVWPASKKHFESSEKKEKK